MPSILEADPDLAEELSGFVYYPNALSQSTKTYGGFHPIVGGAEYTIEEMNQNSHSLARDIIDAFTMIPEALAPLDFETSFIDVKASLAYKAYPQYFKALQQHHIRNYQSPPVNFSLLPNPEVLQGKTNVLGVQWDRFLILVGLFQGFGPTFRKKIYDNGSWHGLISDTETWASLAFFDPYLKLLSLDKLSVLREDEKNSYILIHSNLPHNTGFSGAYNYYGNQEYFAYPLPPVPQEFVEFDREYELANKKSQTLFYANYHSLRIVAKWLHLLKEYGVYDNSIIYLASDHGSRAFDPQLYKAGQNRTEVLERMRAKADHHSLYMVKSLDSKGPLQTSNEFRTAGDIPSELLPMLGVQKNPHTGKKLEPVQSDPLPLFVIFSKGSNEQHTSRNSEFYIRRKHLLHNRNIFEDANWEIDAQPPK